MQLVEHEAVTGIFEFKTQAKGIERADCTMKEGIYANSLAFERHSDARIALGNSVAVICWVPLLAGSTFKQRPARRISFYKKIPWQQGKAKTLTGVIQTFRGATRTSSQNPSCQGCALRFHVKLSGIAQAHAHSAKSFLQPRRNLL